MAAQLVARAEVLPPPAPPSADDEFQLLNWDTTHNRDARRTERVLGLPEDVAAELP